MPKLMKRFFIVSCFSWHIYFLLSFMITFFPTCKFIRFTFGIKKSFYLLPPAFSFINFCSAETMFNTILVVFELIFYGFHFSVLLLLHFKRNTIFNGPFYTIFRTILFSDVACFIMYCGATRMLELNLFPLTFFQADQIVSSIIYTLISSFTVIQFVGHALLSLNRFTLLWFPLKQKAVWSKPWFLVVLFLIPFLHNCYRSHLPGTFVVLADDKTTVAMADPKFNSFHYQMAFSLYGLMTLIAAVLNFLAILKIILRKQNSASFNANEKSLLFVSLVTFGTQVIRIAYVIATNLFGSNKEILGFLIIVSPYVIDIFGCSGSITIMLLSTTTREAYVTFYKLKRKQFSNIITVSSTAPKII